MAKRSDLFWIKPSELKIEEGFNVRQDYGDIESLSNSIEENGVKIPLIVNKTRGKDEYTVVDGHRRYYALQGLSDDIRVPVLVDGRSSNEESRTLGMVIYNGGKKLTLLEESEVYKRLINYGWNQSEIALKIGKSKAHISNCILLTSASTQLKENIREGKISASYVIDGLKSSNSSDIYERVKKIPTKKVTKKHTGSRSISNKFLYTLRKELDDSEAKDDTLDAINLIIRYSERDLSRDELIKMLKNGTL